MASSFLTLRDGEPRSFIHREDGGGYRTLLVVNPAAEGWALAKYFVNVPAPRKVRLLFGEAYYDERSGFLLVVEGRAIGYGGSFINLWDAIRKLGLRMEEHWLVVQNAGSATRLEPFSGKNKGHLPLPNGLAMVDQAMAEARNFAIHSPGGLFHVAAVDMLQKNASEAYTAEGARLLERFGLLITGIPVDVPRLTEAQLRKWGFAICEAATGRVLCFVEHPGRAELLDEALRRYAGKVETKVYFSTFRFHLRPDFLDVYARAMTGALFEEYRARVAPEVVERARSAPSAAAFIEEVGARLSVPEPSELAVMYHLFKGGLEEGFYRGELADFSDVVLEGMTASGLETWERRRLGDERFTRRYSKELWARFFHVARILELRCGGMAVVSAGEGAISEDLGTIDAMKELYAAVQRRDKAGGVVRESLHLPPPRGAPLIVNSYLGTGVVVKDGAMVVNCEIGAGCIEGMVTDVHAGEVHVGPGSWLHAHFTVAGRASSEPLVVPEGRDAVLQEQGPIRLASRSSSSTA
ncbi:LbetaH domain-containing protein [Archangium lipolyticum]|uniref:hypothetical protein n=1 Tax=Archangium lipolyticum TaxID=2970465 RepID=UPI00214A1157|nr:hypothetical protein [Archangium lipolyticum]